ncbi:MAG: hypothetical protein ACREMM_10680 [Gemmatimonadales bacterium]
MHEQHGAAQLRRLELAAHALQRDDRRDLRAMRARDERERRPRLPAADNRQRDPRAGVDAGRHLDESRAQLAGLRGG